MKRLFYDKLLQWKDDPDRKPLIVEGARQTGKTYLINEFGEQEFPYYIYINCDNNPAVSRLFVDFDIERIFRVCSAMSGKPVIPGETLIFFDEIQEIPYGLTSLKYFYENAREVPVVVAGSLLGISLHEGTGFPVGKAELMRLFPMSFGEFLMAMGEGALVDLMDAGAWEDASILREKLTDLLRQYYYVGGMPEAVQCYVQTSDLQKVRHIQQNILSQYRRDFSKHISSVEIPRVNMVWDSIPSQLARDNKKFVYGALKKGARAREFKKAIEWLLDTGLILRAERVSKLEKPLMFYKEASAFKLYLLDVGLLGAMTRTSAKNVLTGESCFVEYKGAFTENYVAQQYASSCPDELYYYVNDRSTVEIDFVTESESGVHPIEVKAEENLRAKSLSSVLQKHPEAFGWRFSMSDFRMQERMANIPLYLAEAWFRRRG